MISLVFMTDKQQVVGGSNLVRNLIRIPFLPMKELSAAMDEIMQGEHIVMGASSVNYYGAKAKNYKEAFVLTRQPNYSTKHNNLQVCTHSEQLIKRYQNSSDTLLVLGGLSMWQLFLPYANELRIAQTHRNVPGDLVFSEWTKSNFELVKQKQGNKLATLIYQRKALG